MTSTKTDDTSAAPKSVAIAGAWGYIGRKFLDAAVGLGAEVFVHDTGPVPCDLDTAQLVETLRANGAYLPQETLSKTMTRSEA